MKSVHNLDEKNLQDIDKFYVSPADKFLFEFDATHDKSRSQLKEIKKHQRISVLRDNPFSTEKEDII